MENLKNIIYQIRDARHITLRDMTGILQLSAGHLSQIENGKKPAPKNFYEKMKIVLDLNVIEDNDLSML
jgi:transcriptional regulator with XRE-family HTH domain